MVSVVSPARRRALIVRPAARLPLLVLGLGLALSACSSPARGPTAAALRPRPSVGAALDAMLRPAGPDTAASFLRTLPATDDVRTVAVTNPHDPRWTDTITTYGFGGLELTVYRVGSTGTRFPIALRVTAPEEASAAGLRLGLDRRQLAAILGTPSVRHGDTLVYRVSAAGQAPYQLEAELREGRVVSLRWSVDLD